MQKIFLIIATFFTLGTFNSFAGLMEVGFEAGLATPSDKINDIYNSHTLQWDKDTLANLINNGLDAGYHIGMNLQMPLNDFFSFAGHIGFNSFPESSIEVKDPTSGEVLATLYTTTRIIPISAGLNFYPFKTFISPYATGELSYNYINSTVSTSQSIPVSQTPSDSRFGFGFGLGVNFDVKVVDIYLEGKFNYTNLIGKESSEPDKSYFTMVLGVIF